MKENFNLEELFKQKFDNFQPEVDPSVWANIQAGIGAGTAAVTGGIAAAVKIGLISGGIIAASVATWYFGFYEPETPAENLTQQTIISEPVENPVEVTEPIIVVNDENDPAILQNQEEIERELRNFNATQQNHSNNTVADNNAGNTTEANTTPNHTVTNSGNVTTEQHTTVTNNDNSTAPDDKHKDQIPTGRMEFTQTAMYAPSSVSFVSNARNFTEVRWDFGDGYTAEGAEAKHAYTKPGKYMVKMTVMGDKSAYEESQEIVVKSKSGIDNVPNVITPNGDRINDVFSIKSTDIETFYITITDNRGNEIFTSNDKDFVWDGTDYSGETVEEGIYTYIIIAEGKDGSVIKLPGQIYVQ